MSKFSTDVILDKRRPREKDGRCPARLRLIIDRKARYYTLTHNSLDHYLTEEEFKKVNGSKPRDDFKKLNYYFTEKKKEADQLLEGMQTPSFDQFSRLFLQRSPGENLVKYYDQYIAECKKDNRHGTASSYECSKNSIDSFERAKAKARGRELEAGEGIAKLNFKDLTKDWLKDYQRYMITEGKSISTIGVYLRPLRFLFNKAVSDGIVNQKHYPFGKGGFPIPSSIKNKRPLELEELLKLRDYDGTPSRNLYRDFFMFSFYLMGLNFGDILNLKWSQYDGKFIETIRRKTQRTTQKRQVTIKLAVNNEAREIIERRGDQGGVYIFPVLSAGDSPQAIRAKVLNFTRNTNQALKEIAKEIGINEKISTVFARHSAASIALVKGNNLAAISEALGHTSIQQTSTYISALGLESKEALGNSLRLG